MTRINSALTRLAGIAESLQRRVNTMLIVSAVATLYLMFLLFSADSSWWWNLLKCGFLAIPWIVWGLVWIILEQLKDSPNTASQLLSDKDEIVQHLSSANRSELTSFRGGFRFLNTLRQQEGFDALLETVGGLSLLMNPLFWVVALAAICVLILMIISAFLLALF